MRYARLIYDYDLPHRAVTVYMYLSNRANKENTCFPSVKTISQDLHISRSTVFRALSELENAGIIERIERYRNSGGRSSTLYKLLE